MNFCVDLYTIVVVYFTYCESLNTPIAGCVSEKANDCEF